MHSLAPMFQKEPPIHSYRSQNIFFISGSPTKRVLPVITIDLCVCFGGEHRSQEMVNQKLGNGLPKVAHCVFFFEGDALVVVGGGLGSSCVLAKRQNIPCIVKWTKMIS